MTSFWSNLPHPILVLAPMDDVTDFAFREVLSKIGKPDVLVTEFTSVDGLLSRGKAKVVKKLDYSEKQRPIVAQLWGADPQKFKEAAKLVCDLGFDGIDINMGCPDKGVMAKNSGAALINNYTLVTEIIENTKLGAPSLPLSIKTRLAPTNQLTKAWLTFLLAQGLSALTLHLRTAADMSKTPADWDEAGKLVALKNLVAPETIILGNGDVKSQTDAHEKYNQFKVDGVMVGRAIFTNPWFFSKEKADNMSNQKLCLQLLLDHTKLFTDHWGKTKNFEIMKKFFKVYVAGFPGAGNLRAQLMLTKDYYEVETLIRNQLR